MVRAKTRVFVISMCKNACMDVSWDDLRSVMLLVRHRTLAEAAGAMGVSYTTVARRMKRAEDALGTILFERLPDGYRPTDAAHRVAEHAARMETHEHDLRRALQGRDRGLTGRLTLTAPQLLISGFLLPILDEFQTAYPQVELRIVATNDLLDLNRLEADLAIRISNEPGDTLKGLRLSGQDHASFASVEMAKHIQKDPDKVVDWIVHDGNPAVPQPCNPAYPNHQMRFRFSDMSSMIAAAQAGLGVVRLPMFLGRQTDGLVQVPVLPPKPYLDIWVVSHADVWPSEKLRAFREILVPHFKKHADLFRS